MSKKLVTEGAAEKDGRLQPGDRILGVDNQSLQGLTQEHAAQILKNTGDTVKLTIAQQAAQYYGLTHLINQPSPAHARKNNTEYTQHTHCLLYTSPSPRDRQKSRMPSSA